MAVPVRPRERGRDAARCVQCDGDATDRAQLEPALARVVGQPTRFRDDVGQDR